MSNTINYFKYFPTIKYNNKTSVNLTRRTQILQQLYSSPLSFLSYTIKDDERPEDVALYYYGDSGKVWLVFLANNIIDPTSEWPLTTNDFNNMMLAKYATQAGLDGYDTDADILRWTGTTSETSNILYYENADGLQLTKDTYDLNDDLGLITTSEWTPVRIYDYELELNEKKRNIFLFNSIYATQAESELKELLSV